MSRRNDIYSKEAFAKAQAIFPGGVNSPVRAFKSVDGEPFIVSHAQGAYLYDIDGNRYVDFVLSWGPLVLGHAYPLVVDAIVKQAARGTSYGAPCELERMLAEKIIENFPSIEMLRFVNSGTEAGMAAIRLARGYTGREKVIKFAGCYHGHVDALLARAGSGVATLGIPDCAGIPQSTAASTICLDYNDLDSVKAAFESYGEEIAAVIIEPIVGNSGFILPQNDFLAELRKVTLQYGALLIFDEVMTGFRVSLGGAQEIYGVKPDLTMLGKVIGGGLPVGAFGGRKEIMSYLAPLGPVYQAGTLSGNPLAMAAGLATLNDWCAPNVFDEVAKNCTALVQSFRESACALSVPLHADSRGSMFGVFFREGAPKNLTDAKNSDVAMFKRFFHESLEQGVYFAPSPFEAGFLSQAHLGEPLSYSISVVENVLKACAK